MFKKMYLSLFVLGSAAAIAACSNPYEASMHRAEVWQPLINMPTSVVVCRSKQCAPAELSMSKEYVYNSLLHLLDNNTQNKALICAADSRSHVCTNPYLTLPITVGVTPANMFIDSVNIADISASIGNKSLDLLLNYYVTFNGQTPTCKPAKTLLYVKDARNIVMEDSGYSCKMTTIGNTTVKSLFAIDYIDLDYGYIGGYYSIGLSGPAYGGGSGYMLLRLPNDAYPLAPNLTAPAAPETIPFPITEQVIAQPFGQQVNTNAVQPAGMIVPCANKRNCSPATDKKMMLKEPKLPNEEPETISEQLSNSETYGGVQVFPLISKKTQQKTADTNGKNTTNNTQTQNNITNTTAGATSHNDETLKAFVAKATEESKPTLSAVTIETNTVGNAATATSSGGKDAKAVTAGETGAETKPDAQTSVAPDKDNGK